MPFEFHGDWDAVIAIHPSVLKTFFFLVLPFSFIPPLSLLYAGNSQFDLLFWLRAGDSRWQDVAWIFLIAELITVPLMGWLIQKVALQRKCEVSYADSFLLAALIAVPMWLSSLGLLVSNLSLMILIGCVGLWIAANLLYHGIYTLLHMQDPFEAQSMSYHIFSVGAIVWLLLCTYIVLPVLNL